MFGFALHIRRDDCTSNGGAYYSVHETPPAFPAFEQVTITFLFTPLLEKTGFHDPGIVSGWTAPNVPSSSSVLLPVRPNRTRMNCL
jgi:hypothetical protein